MNRPFVIAKMLIIIKVLTFISAVVASGGDHSDVFRQCVFHLDNEMCHNETRIKEVYKQQPLPFKVTMWSCLDECKYYCMWRTVDVYVKYGHQIPQFYGKWPFIRFCGMQEPASALFSVLNGLSFYIMWKKFRRKVPYSAPTYYVWNGYAMISMNAWLWSTIFHTRDTPITEMMDYICATSGVLYSFFGLCARILWQQPKYFLGICAVLCCLFYFRHIHYLIFVHFDYGYNMRASVFVGLLNTVGWLFWCSSKWRHQKYIWKCATVVLLVNLLLLLELGDFPPLWWTFDAHSLWHLGTIPLPILWYSFLIEDCNDMLHRSLSSRKLV